MDLTDARAIRTRSKILTAACDAIVEQGLQTVTMEDIAQRAGVSRSTLYRHWARLPELVIAAVDAAVDQIESTNAQEPIAQIVEVIAGLGTALRTEPWATVFSAIVECARRDPELEQLHRQYVSGRRQRCFEAVAAAQRLGQLRSDIETEWIVTSLGAPLFFHHLVLHLPLTAEAVAEHTERMLDLLRPAQVISNPV